MDLEATSMHGANRIYELCGAFEFDTHPVSNPTLQELHRAYRDLRSSLAEDRELSPWPRFLRKSYRLLFCLHVAPVSPDAPLLRYKEQLVEAREDLEKYAHAYPDFFGPATSLLTGLEEYLNDKRHPMLTSVLEICERAEGESIALLARPNHIKMIDESIRRVSSLENVSVIGVQNLRTTMKFWDVLLIAGSQKDTYGEFPPRHVLESPRSGKTHFLFHDNFQFQWNPRPRPVFLGGITSEGSLEAETKIPSHFYGEFVNPPAQATSMSHRRSEVIEVTSPELNLMDMASSVTGRTSRTGLDAVAANVVLLEGEKLVLLESDPSAKALVLRVSADGSPEVDQALVADLDAESYLVLRGESGTDYIVSLADRLLGSHKETLRSAQMGWKKGLRQIVLRRGGLSESVELLKTKGLAIASPENVRNWINPSPRKIAPQKREHFEIILQAINHEGLLDHSVSEYWMFVEKIRTAHRKASHQMRRMLLDHLKGINLDPLLNEGHMEIAMDDMDVGTLFVGRFLDMLPEEVFVDPSHIGQLDDLGDM